VYYQYYSCIKSKTQQLLGRKLKLLEVKQGQKVTRPAVVTNRNRERNSSLVNTRSFSVHLFCHRVQTISPLYILFKMSHTKRDALSQKANPLHLQSASIISSIPNMYLADLLNTKSPSVSKFWMNVELLWP